MSALGHKRTFAAQKGMSALPPKADMCSATRRCPLSAKSGHQRTSSEAVLLVFRGPCCKPSNLQTMPGSPSLSHYMASMLGKCWWKIVTATTASARWATDNPHDWEDAIAPLAKGERGRAFKAISPGMLPPLGIIFGLFCRVHWAVHTWERGQPREPLSRTGRCSITVLPPSRPFCQSRSETRRLGAGA